MAEAHICDRQWTLGAVAVADETPELVRETVMEIEDVFDCCEPLEATTVATSIINPCAQLVGE
jgi:hypothetical protein